jgi:hypothetical protein
VTWENHVSVPVVKVDAGEQKGSEDALSRFKAAGTPVAMVVNFTAEPLDLPKASIIGTAQEMAENVVIIII